MKDIRKNNKKLAKKAQEYLNQGKIKYAEEILEILKKKEVYDELQFMISALEIDIGSTTKKVKYIEEGIKNLEELKDKTEIFVDYNLANGYYAKYKIMNKKPDYLTKEEHLLAKAKSLYLNCIGRVPKEELPLVYINLGNTYDHIGRTIEALEFYEKTIMHPYSIVNKGITLCRYSELINNPTPILKDAYDCFKSIEKFQKIPLELKEISKTYIKLIESNYDKQILEQKEDKTLKISSKNDNEIFMIEFCLKNKLYLNICNFCQRCNNAIGDRIIIPNMLVNINTSLENDPYLNLSSKINQIKMEFALSRFLLILSENHSINLDFISKNIVLIDTLSYEENNIRIELLKKSFTSFYNILDKISHLINEYFGLNKKPAKVNFHNIWFNKQKKINGKLNSSNNQGLNALYDIHLELEPEHEKYYLRKIRNNLTHNFLQIKCFKIKDELTKSELRDNTIKLAKIVRNAIIYLIMAIDINEKQKAEKYKDKIIPKKTSITRIL